jgi:hypothetical protein
MMERRAFVVGSLAVLAAPLAAQAQQAGKVYRLGILSSGGPPPPGTSSGLLHLIEALRELGYVEGQGSRLARCSNRGPRRRGHPLSTRQETQKAASSLGVRLIVVEVRGAEYERAFATIVAERADALAIMGSPILFTDRRRIIAILVFFMGAHYGSPIEYSETTLQAARAQAKDFRDAFRVAATRPSDLTWEHLTAALDDDFDTPRALAILHGWRAAGRLDLLARGLAVFDLAIDQVGANASPEASRLAEERQVARARRDYAEADRLRGEIERLGWEVQDVPGGFRLIPKTG